MTVKIKDPTRAAIQTITGTLKVRWPTDLDAMPFEITILPSIGFTWETEASTAKGVSYLKEFIHNSEHRDYGDYEESTGIFLKEHTENTSCITIQCKNKSAFNYLLLSLGIYFDTQPVWNTHYQHKQAAQLSEAEQLAALEALMGGGTAAKTEPSSDAQLLSNIGLLKKDPRRQMFPSDDHQTKSKEERTTHITH